MFEDDRFLNICRPARAEAVLVALADDDGRFRPAERQAASAQTADRASACSKTVWVAFSCLSGG